MEGPNVILTRVNKEPDRRGLAELYMNRILGWFSDPEHEKEYQDWKKQREKLRKGA